jgi:hypothetical protein
VRKEAEQFLQADDRSRIAVFRAAADKLKIPEAYIEKDFWVCLALDALFNHLPDGSPRILFKGGTSLSKAYGLINRFSEDLDIVLSREDLGFSGGRDPLAASSRRKREVLAEELRAASSTYINGPLMHALSEILAPLKCKVETPPEGDEADDQTLLIRYPSLYAGQAAEYVKPAVRIEGGARSAFEPNEQNTLSPYIANTVRGIELVVPRVTTIKPERTFLDKVFAIHGTNNRYRNTGKEPKARQSRHYHDVAILAAKPLAERALTDQALINNVREHSIMMFRRGGEQLDEAVPGRYSLVPDGPLFEILERDYQKMREMLFGDIPEFHAIVESIRTLQVRMNRPNT